MRKSKWARSRRRVPCGWAGSRDGLVTGLVSHSETDEEDRLHYASTDWMIVTANPALLETPAIKRVIQSVAARPDLRSWSDDFNNLYRILK